MVPILVIAWATELLQSSIGETIKPKIEETLSKRQFSFQLGRGTTEESKRDGQTIMLQFVDLKPHWTLYGGKHYGRC